MKRRMSFFQFCDKLIEDGMYIGEDNHIHRKDGRLLSRQARNGYYTVRKMYNTINYCFMEHRVIWYFHYGEFDESLVINHKDFDRANNDINNLELITQKENTAYSKCNMPDVRGHLNHRACLTEKEVQLAKYLCKHGYKQKEVAELLDVKNVNTISRVVTGARYGNVEDAESIISLYPLLIEKTRRNDLTFEEQIKNASMGLTGEAGEVVDIIKKYAYQGHELEIEELTDELGDVMYYLCWLCILLQIDFSEICFNNMNKLTKRYPNGFEAERSINRTE